MTFIVIFAALLVERFFHWGQIRNWRWFSSYQQWVGAKTGTWSPYLLLITCVLPLVLIVGLVGLLLSGWLFAILKLIFDFLILIYCMGPHNLWLQTYNCVGQLNHQDQNAAIQCVETDFGIKATTDSQALHYSFLKAIFQEAYLRIFSVVFWFAVLGPMGAVLYRMIALMSVESPLGISLTAAEVQRWLDWIPVRIFTFVFALAGNFIRAFSVWKKYVFKGLATTNALLTEGGVSALGVSSSDVLAEDGSIEKEALALLERTFITILVIVAAVVLAV